MRCSRFPALTAVLGLLLLAAGLDHASAHPHGRGGGGWGPGDPYGRTFDPRSVVTVSGEVVAVEQSVPLRGMHAGVHLKLRSGKETLTVHLGPAWFIERQDVELAPKDRLEVTGSRVTIDGKPVVIAAEVARGDQVLKLRDRDGRPVWAGWHQRHR